MRLAFAVLAGAAARWSAVTCWGRGLRAFGARCAFAALVLGFGLAAANQAHADFIIDNFPVSGTTSVTEGGTVTFNIVDFTDPNETINVRLSQTGNYITGISVVEGVGSTAVLTHTLTIPVAGGMVDGTITVSNLGLAVVTLTFGQDMIGEANGTATFEIRPGTGYAVNSSDDTATINFTDDDGGVSLPTVNVAAAAASVAEGGNAEFAFTLSANAAAGGVTIPFTLAHTGKLSDASVTSGSVTIAAGSSAATHRVATVDDRIDEDDGSITLTLGTLPATHTAGSSNSAMVAVTDNDDPPFIVINDPSVLEGGGSTLQFAFRLVDGAGQAVTSDKEVTVMFATTGDGTATAGTDFTARSGTATFSAGLGSVTRGISPIDDMDSEGNETVVMQLSMPVNAGFQGGAATITGTGTLIDDEMPVVAIAADSGSVTEGADAVFILSLSEAHTAELAVPVTVAQTGRVTAAAGERTVAVPQGAMEARFTVAITDDNTDEADGSVTATIGALPATHAGADGSASVTVQDDEAPPVITVMDGGGAEGGTAVFPLRLAPASGAPDGNVSDLVVTVSFAASRETGDTAVAGTDFEAVMGVVTFAPGADAAEARVNLPMADADLDEATFTLTLSGPMNATFAGGGTAPVTAVGRVLELPGLGIVADDADGSVSEGEMAVFTVSLSRVPTDGAAVTVPVSVAATGNLHGALPDSVTIAAGQLSAKLTVPLSDDRRDEADGSITVTISLPAGREDEFTFSGSATAMLTVTDDDDAPRVSVVAAEDTLEGRVMRFPVRLSGASERQVSVAYTTEGSSGTATAGQDYETAAGTLTFAPDRTEHVVEVAISRDRIVDPGETVVLTLSEPTNAALGTASASGLITEGLSADEIDALNEAILPHIAAAVAFETADAIGDRINAAFDGSPRGGIGSQWSGGLPSSLQSLADSPLHGVLGMVNNRPTFGVQDVQFTFGDRVTFWGSGYIRDVSLGDSPIEFDGDITGFMLAADTRLTPDIVVGLALNSAQSSITWKDPNFTGEHETSTMSFHPYFGWQAAEGTRLWASFGFGSGDLELTEDDSPDFMFKRDTDFQSASIGAYGPISDTAHDGGGNTRLGFIADAGFAQIEESETDTVRVEAGWYRGGLQYDYAQAPGAADIFGADGVFGATAELTLRHDFGDSRNGGGIELSGGVDYHLPSTGLSFDIEARTLLTHNQDLEEWGLSASITYEPDFGNPGGLTIAFKPQWGMVGSTRDQLWNGGFAAAPSAQSPVLDSRLRGNDGAPAMSYILELKYPLRAGH